MKIRTFIFLLILAAHSPHLAAAHEIFVNGEWIETDLFFEMICTNEPNFQEKLKSRQYDVVDETALKEIRYDLKVFLRDPELQADFFAPMELRKVCNLVFKLQQLNLTCYALNEDKPADLSLAVNVCSPPKPPSPEPEM